MPKSMREKILSVTAKIIATEGLDGVSIRHVCEKAEVKAPTVYYYFNDKDGLIEAVVALAYKRYTKKQLELVKNESPLNGLIKSWDVFFDFVEDETDLYHAIIIAHLRQRIPPEGYDLFGVIVQIFKKLEDKNKLKFDHLTASRIFYATAYGLALVYVSQGKNPSLKPNITLTRDLCISGLLC
jgi:AcrR family transcriptional regulator